MGFIRDAIRREDQIRAAAQSPALPSAQPPEIASPWADSSALEVATWAGLLDAIDAMPITRHQAVAIPAVARGRDLIATTVSRFPLFAQTSAGRLATQPRIVAQPEPGRARVTTLTWTVDSLIFHGAAFWFILDRYAPDTLGGPMRPRTCRWIPPSQVDLDSNGEIRTAWGMEVNPARDVIRFDGPHEGFLSRGRQTVRDARRLAFAASRASDNPIPAMELHQTAGDQLEDHEITALIAGWAAARRGENGGVAYTNQSIQAIPHGAQPEQLLIAGRDAAALDVARHLNLPAWAVDAPSAGDSLTYTNVPSRSRELIDYTLAGYMEAITGRLSLDDILPAGTWASFSTDVLTDGDFADRMTAGKAAVESGIYSAAELRAREAGLPMENGVPTP